MQVLTQIGCLVLIPISEVLPNLEESIIGFIGCKCSVVQSSFFAAEMVSLVFWREKHTLQFLSKSTSGFLDKSLLFGHLEFRNYIFSRGLLNPELGISKTHFVLKKIMLLNLFLFCHILFGFLLLSPSLPKCLSRLLALGLSLFTTAVFQLKSIHWSTLWMVTVVTCHWEDDELSSKFWISLSPNINAAVEGYQTCIWLLQSFLYFQRLCIIFFLFLFVDLLLDHFCSLGPWNFQAYSVLDQIH